MRNPHNVRLPSSSLPPRLLLLLSQLSFSHVTFTALRSPLRPALLVCLALCWPVAVTLTASRLIQYHKIHCFIIGAGVNKTLSQDHRTTTATLCSVKWFNITPLYNARRQSLFSISLGGIKNKLCLHKEKNSKNMIMMRTNNHSLHTTLNLTQSQEWAKFIPQLYL